MTQNQTAMAAQPVTTDHLTLIAISALAYVLATFLHELLGHGGACVALGSRPTEIGAFYVNCDYANLSGVGVRLVALAGPVISLLSGVVGLLVLRRLPVPAFRAKYFTWLLSGLGLMGATGYLLFSGITGIGDFGTSQDGVLYQATPAWAWQAGITLLGLVSYLWVAIILAHAMDRIIGGTGVERIRRARLLALTSYLTGGVVSVLIGLLNPLGIFIVLVSSVASSLGGSSGLLWIMQLLKRKTTSPAPLLQITRDWRWIAVGIIVTVLYAVILGPSLHP
jgi:hypothetical protein